MFWLLQLISKHNSMGLNDRMLCKKVELYSGIEDGTIEKLYQLLCYYNFNNKCEAHIYILMCWNKSRRI